MSGELGRWAPLGSRPWAFPLNRTRTSERVEISLLALVVVDGLVRISGLVRVGRPDLRLAHAPELLMSQLDAPPMTARGTHVVPTGELTWVSWDFERPPAVLVAYRGQVDRLELARGGGRGELTIHGPWVFEFDVPSQRTRSRQKLETRDPSKQAYG